jgi:hypothetical protein
MKPVYLAPLPEAIPLHPITLDAIILLRLKKKTSKSTNAK